MTDTPPSPGSDAAIAKGCTCPVLDNAHGNGYMGIAGVYVYSGDCPLHALRSQDWTEQDELGRSKHRAGIL
jgi:hypothetical protein